MRSRFLHCSADSPIQAHKTTKQKQVLIHPPPTPQKSGESILQATAGRDTTSLAEWSTFTFKTKQWMEGKGKGLGMDRQEGRGE